MPTPKKTDSQRPKVRRVVNEGCLVDLMRPNKCRCCGVEDDAPQHPLPTPPTPADPNFTRCPRCERLLPWYWVLYEGNREEL